jgi:hypothetical protein
MDGWMWLVIERWIVRMGMPDRFDADEWKDKKQLRGS